MSALLLAVAPFVLAACFGWGWDARGRYERRTLAESVEDLFSDR